MNDGDKWREFQSLLHRDDEAKRELDRAWRELQAAKDRHQRVYVESLMTGHALNAFFVTHDIPNVREQAVPA